MYFLRVNTAEKQAALKVVKVELSKLGAVIS
jgi:hypothetical protein